MRIDLRRALTFVALLGWASFFDYLWLSGESLRFVGTRTQWVIPFGGITLSLVALLALGGLWRGRGERVGRRDRAGLGVVLAPVLAILLIPAPVLGALAARNKASVADYKDVAAKIAQTGGPLTVFDIAVATRQPEFAEARGVVPGVPVKVSGLVSATRTGGFDISRFQARCCAADAIPFTVSVTSSQTFDTDTWIAVVGTLERSDDGVFSIRATSAHTAPIGEDAYLSS